MSNTTPPDQPEDAALRQAILKAGTVRFASGSFIQKHYSNDTVSPVEHKVQEIVEIDINDLMQLFHEQQAKAVQAARIDECRQLKDVTKVGDNWMNRLIGRIAELQAAQPPAADTTDHSHRFTGMPEIRGAKCSCGVVRFATRYGMAEYDPETEVTTLVSSGKVLYDIKNHEVDTTKQGEGE